MNQIEKLEQAWYTLTDEQRWKRLPGIQEQQKTLIVMLDNDITYLTDTKDHDLYLEFDEDIGWRGGIIDLLKAFNIKGEPV